MINLLVIALTAGAILSPYAANLIKPLQYAAGSQDSLVNFNLAFTRIVLDIQLVICGIQLPPKYLFREWKSLAFLLGLGMAGMWLCSSLLVWALIPSFRLVHALAVGACVASTDSILLNTILKDSANETKLPRDLRHLLVAESGANDGLGFPFLLLALFLLQYVEGGASSLDQPGLAMKMWFQEAWAHQVLLGTAYGAVTGFIGQYLVRKAHDKILIERDNLLAMPLTLALFVLGTCGLIGSDDVLASFIAGNFFTLDDFFISKVDTDRFQDLVDMLLNLVIFFWLGAACPWRLFYYNETVPFWRLILLGGLILSLRRIPVVFLLQWNVRQLRTTKETLFMGHFGPIGVSSIFYLHFTLKMLESMVAGQPNRKDLTQLIEIITIVVWFLTVSSIVRAP